MHNYDIHDIITILNYICEKQLKCENCPLEKAKICISNGQKAIEDEILDIIAMRGI